MRKSGILDLTKHESRRGATNTRRRDIEGLSPMHDHDTIPYGYCHCGCGGKTAISPYNNARYGYVKGQPRQFIRGHVIKGPQPHRFLSDGSVEITLANGMKMYVDREDWPLISRYTWFAGKSRGTWYGQRKRRTSVEDDGPIKAHHVILPPESGKVVDHIDGNGLNNRRSNLRLATNAENSRNARRSRLNTSGYKGVSFHKDKGKWIAGIYHHRQRIEVGAFDNPIEAARAYDDKARALFGEFAKLNFPDEEMADGKEG